MAIGPILATLLIVIPLLIFLKRRRQQRTPIEDSVPTGDVAELPQGKHYEKAEIPALSKPGELESSPNPEELHGESVALSVPFSIPRKPVLQQEEQAPAATNGGSSHA